MLCHNEQTAVLLLKFGLGHVLQYTPFILNFSALHFTHSYTTQEGVPKFLHFDTPSFFTTYIDVTWFILFVNLFPSYSPSFYNFRFNFTNNFCNISSLVKFIFVITSSSFNPYLITLSSYAAGKLSTS